MKHFIAAVFASAISAVLVADDAVVSANATLKDGSTVKGEFLTQKITGSTVFANQLALDPTIIKSFTFTSTNGEAKVSLVNGDAFAMTIANESFAIKSILGELNIPRTNFRSLAFSVRKCAQNGAEDGLIFYCTFDDETSITSPVVGPIGECFAPSFQDGKSGNALLCPAYVSCASFLFPKTFLEQLAASNSGRCSKRHTPVSAGEATRDSSR